MRCEKKRKSSVASRMAFLSVASERERESEREMEMGERQFLREDIAAHRGPTKEISTLSISWWKLHVRRLVNVLFCETKFQKIDCANETMVINR